MGNYVLKYILWVNKLCEINENEYNGNGNNITKNMLIEELKTIIINDKETLLPLIIEKLKLDINTSILVVIGTVLEADNTLVEKIQIKNNINIIEFSHAFELLKVCTDVEIGFVGAVCAVLHPIWYLFYNLYEGQFFMQKPFCMRKEILGWILAGYIEEKYLKITDVKKEDYYEIQEAELNNIMLAIENTSRDKNIIVVIGKCGSGRKSLVKRAAFIKGKQVVYIDCDIVFKKEEDNKLIEAATAGILFNMNICLINVREEYAYMIKCFNLHMKTYGIVVFAVSEDKAGLSMVEADIAGNINVNKKLTKQDRIYVWQSLFDKNVAEYTKMYDADIGEIIGLSDEIKNIIREGGYSKDKFNKAFNICIKNRKYYCSYGTLINPDSDMEGFIGSKEIIKIIDLIIFNAKNRFNIYDILESAGDTKKSLVILIHGASGTGKTMLASIIASKLERLILKADLSQVTDKYIGETEKHLDELFELTSKSNCVLFFDEADALFSKRTQVSSSHDKYSNISVSYLLQKIDSFSGIVVLATNIINNFDEAFLRRINYIIKLSTPDNILREKMWKKQIEAIGTVDKNITFDIDYEFLARSYKLSLARIKNSVHLAYIMALKDNKSHINMEHIKEAVRIELVKEGKAVFLDTFDE